MLDLERWETDGGSVMELDLDDLDDYLMRDELGMTEHDV